MVEREETERLGVKDRFEEVGICRRVEIDDREEIPGLDMRGGLEIRDWGADRLDMDRCMEVEGRVNEEPRVTDRVDCVERMGALGRLMEREGILRLIVGAGRPRGAERADGAGRLVAAHVKVPRSPMSPTIDRHEPPIDLCRNITGLLSEQSIAR